MLVLSGSEALSEFRAARLLVQVRERLPSARAVYATYVYFVDAASELDPESFAVLRDLLDAGSADASSQPRGDALVVVPRPGTVSPWSTKATDIARNCGVRVLERVERGIAYIIDASAPLTPVERRAAEPLIHDRMTQAVLAGLNDAARLFEHEQHARPAAVELSPDPWQALARVNEGMGLALSDEELGYLADSYRRLDRNPSEVELVMFAQANSEHCRHKIFNSEWSIDGAPRSHSLFDMIRGTHRRAPQGVVSAYADNAAIVQGSNAAVFRADPRSGGYAATPQALHLVIKVETHNHPTAISPAPGAATGAGGEIRDEGATGRGGKPKAGLCGFSVSNLRIPGFEQPWETDHGRPGRMASAVEIMLDGPVGAATYNNEFGRPSLAGYFRTFEQWAPGPNGSELRGYHKPIMLAGGLGNILAPQVAKAAFPAGTPVVVIGGPAMAIGLGGGAASSMASGDSTEELDFASVQRANAEMQRRCQEVIDRCAAQGADNPILAIHDVGAGGLSNAVPELMHDARRGGRFELRAVPSAEPSMSPMQLWCNEAQERYVLAVDEARLAEFQRFCERERCPQAVIGEATDDGRLVVTDRHFGDTPVDLPMEVLLGGPPRPRREARRESRPASSLELAEVDLEEAVRRVLRLPSVAAKTFLITIGDRTVSGLVARDQMVGPWQVPVADVAVTLSDHQGYSGEAMAIGERAPVALVAPAASARMAVGEALTNIAAAPIDAIGDVKLSANWMAAAGHPGEDAALYDAVQAVAEALCPALGIAIPVGKDSLSMKTLWREDGEAREVTAPLSLIVSAFAPVSDVRRALTPRLRTDCDDSELILVDLGKGRQRLAGSALAQVYEQVGDEAPDVDDPARLTAFFACIQKLNAAGLVLAYHDRSDGGLLATVCEMAFAGHTGVTVDIDPLGDDPLASLFNEELGAVLQVHRNEIDRVQAELGEAGLGDCSHAVGVLDHSDRLVFRQRGKVILDRERIELQRLWNETSYQLQALRDNPETAREEFEATLALGDSGLSPHLGFDPQEDVTRAYIGVGVRPRVAILREQGVNGQIEMAAAFDRAGFEAVDVHMSDLVGDGRDLREFKGLAACGGFSYGDVLGAGAGWAKSILYSPRARAAFERFFARPDTFSLGVCNGCQMFSHLRDLIPGAGHWPQFVRNRSEQFEARLSLVEVLPSPSVLLAGMQGSVLPIPIAHGEGRADFRECTAEAVLRAGLVGLRFVDHHGHGTERYPDNPNGSPAGIAGLTTVDGRVTILMPHPERAFRTVQHSWHPDEWGEDGPWLRLFRNARVRVD